MIYRQIILEAILAVACTESRLYYLHKISECFDPVRSVLADESKMAAPMLPRDQNGRAHVNAAA